jgi:hypothetical protein
LVVSPSKHNERVPVKWIENRTWIAGINPGEKLLIHASGTRAADYEYNDYGLSVTETPHGAIIGYVTFLGCFQLNLLNGSDRMSNENNAIYAKHIGKLRSTIEKHTGYRPKHGAIHAERERHIYHWLLADPVMLDEPIACNGKLKLWRFE